MQYSSSIQPLESAVENRKPGFTLIEMSIVLVIIGLIIGGILMGRTMIRSAELRAQVSQIEQINTAVITFKLKYDGLPGDITGSIFFGTGTLGGNNNGRILGLVSSVGSPWNELVAADGTGGWMQWGGNDGMQQVSEWSFVFDHLSAAGLMQIPRSDASSTSTASTQHVPGIGYPSMKLQSVGNSNNYTPGMNSGESGVVVGYEASGPGLFSTTVPAGHHIRLGAGRCWPPGWGASVMCFQAGMNPADAQALDAKMDDGMPLSGTMLAQFAYGPQYSVTDNGTCLISSGGQYLYRTESQTIYRRSCAPIIKANF